MSSMKYYFLIVGLLISGCISFNDGDKIEITSEYIINGNWNSKSHSLKINKMKLKEDSIIVDFANSSQASLTDKLEIDSSFIYVAIIDIKPDERYSKRKIFFNRYNGFYWGLGRNSNIEVKSIGNLEKNKWYKFSELTQFIAATYVYIDSVGIVHRFDVAPSNW